MNSPQQLMVPTNTGLPVPVLADSPDVPRDMLALATALDNVTVPVFANAAARDAARTAGATFGMCFVGGIPYRLKGAGWVQLADWSDLPVLPIPPVYLGAATMTVATLPAGGGTLGLSSTLTIAAQPYPRLLAVSFSGMCTSVSGTSVNFILRNGTTEIDRATVGNAYAQGRGVFHESLPATTTRAYNLVLQGSLAASATNDSRTAFLNVWSLGSM